VGEPTKEQIMADMKADELVLAYRKIRDVINAKEEAHKEEIADLKAQQDVLSAALLDLCNEQNLDSIRTPAGTVTRTVSTRYWTNDWESMYDFIRENEAMHLLEQRIHNGNMKQFLSENPDDLPVGLQADTKYVVRVRKPTAK
jgi:predicted secreted Zn-dependent protease